MKAFTLHQPYATAVALRCKRVETRGTRTNHRGDIAIHAGASFLDGYRPLFQGMPAAHALHFGTAGFGLFEELPFGAVVAIATIEDVVPVENFGEDYPESLFKWKYHFTKSGEKLGGEHERYWGDYRPGRFAWILTNIRRLTKPIPARGNQGLWDWTPPADLTFAA